MTKQVKTLKIEKLKVGYRPIVIGKEEKQRLTINSNGMVWFTAYGMSDDHTWTYKALRKMRFKIDPSIADRIIDKAESTVLREASVKDEVFVMEADVEPDKISLADKAGIILMKNVLERISPAVDALYDFIRQSISIEWLLEFDYELKGE